MSSGRQIEKINAVFFDEGFFISNAFLQSFPILILNCPSSLEYHMSFPNTFFFFHIT